MSNIEEIKQTLLENGYIYMDIIGSGSFSEVYLCQNEKYNHFFAIKRVTKKDKVKVAENEIDALISLIHPSIVKLYQTFTDTNCQYLVMEYCPKGTIKEMKKMNREKFIFYAKQLVEVLKYCHSQKVAHRDIKPDNIFIDMYNHAKLGDFGFADKFNINLLTSEKCGSAMFCSPEIFTNTEFDPFKADIWALGVTFYSMITGHLPFPNCDIDTLKNLITYGQIDFLKDSDVDPQIQFLIMKMTTKNPMFRPSAEQLLKFPIFNDMKGKRMINSKSLASFSRKSISHLSLHEERKLTFSNDSIKLKSENIENIENTEQSEIEIPISIKTSKIHSFRSLNFNLPPRQHFIKFD